MTTVDTPMGTPATGSASLCTSAPDGGVSLTPVTAAVTTSRRTVEYRKLPAPVPTPGVAVVSMATVTLCGTDLHIWDDDYATELPIIQGHEASGVVTALDPADEATGQWSVGDRVAISPMFSCGECYACSIGRVNACRHMTVYGCYQDGSLVTRQAVPLDHLHRVPETLGLDLAPMCEPVSIAMQAVRRGRAESGEMVLVCGAGPIGLLATVYLKDLGCDVTVADLSPSRVQLAATLGADRTVTVGHPEAMTADLYASLLELTGGNGPSLVIDATGAAASVATAVDLVATAGRVVCVGISDAELRLSLRTLPVKEIDLLGSRNSQGLLGESLQLLDRHQDRLAGLITHRFPFDRLDEALATLADPAAGVGKIAIDFPDPPIPGPHDRPIPEETP
jgi:L-gulonate 5-dehydrogenase